MIILIIIIIAVNGQSRHNPVNKILCRAFNAANAYATREPHSLCGCNDTRPDGETQIPWKRGRCLAWDATCPNIYAQWTVLANNKKAGSAATEAELKKLTSTMTSTMTFSK